MKGSGNCAPIFTENFFSIGGDSKGRKTHFKQPLSYLLIGIKSENFLSKGHTLPKIFVYIPQGKPSSTGKHRIEPLKVPPEVLDKIIRIDRKKHFKCFFRKFRHRSFCCL